jgi:hypothetical protein
MNSINGVLLALVLLGGLGWFLLEMRLRALRTRVLQIPGGLLFEAQDFSVQVLRKEQELRVRHARGVWTPPGGSAVQNMPQAGRTECTFAAPGFRLEVRECLQQQEAGQTTATRTGHFDLVMRGGDDSRLILERVNGSVTKSFELFFLQVSHWIDKLEKRAEQARVLRLRSEEEAAQADQYAQWTAQLLGSAAQKAARPQAERDKITAAQIARWREAAGFTGQHSLHKADANGLVLWFIDVAADGRITLHADKRTIHATLRGASVASTGGDLEVGVRDAYWTEAEPELQVFKVLRGVSTDERRAWKERLEIIRNALPAAAAAAP